MSPNVARIGLAALALVACSRAPLNVGPAGAAGAHGAAGALGAAGAVGTGAAGAPSGGGQGGGVVVPTDPGHLPPHHLNTLEYDNTVRDLLGVPGVARQTFQPDEQGEFDNDAEALTINDARYEQYAVAAETLADATFADPALRARILTCQPGNDAIGCARQIAKAFGGRAWRRPLTDTEIGDLSGVAAAALADGETFEGAIRRLVTAALSSLPFLYHLETDPDPTSTTPHLVGPYELASRLSYWLWSTMPDEALLGAAADGSLMLPANLVAQVERMLADPRADNFVESFGGQWLGERRLAIHQVEPATFPKFDEAARASMLREQHAFVASYLLGARPFSGLLTQELGEHRRGLLGLAGVLTATSSSYRTSPTSRGEWVLDEVLCDPPPPPPVEVPKLEPNPPAEPMTFRQKVEALSKEESCAACHRRMDGIGLGLEEFDAVGAYRTKNPDGTAVDTSGTFYATWKDSTAKPPVGTPFVGEAALASLLATDPRFLSCTVRKALTYAAKRGLRGATDDATLAGLQKTWAATDQTFPALLRAIVVSDPFRYRRGEAP
jgi:hypothetical protein